MFESLLYKEIENSNENISIIFKDLTNNKDLFIFNENRIFPSASLIKIPIMVEAFKKIESNQIQLDQKIKVNPRDKVDFSIISVLDLEEYSLKDLITLMIIVSDNTATNLLINLLGFEDINNRILDLGCQDTILQRKMMDFESAKEGRENYTSPLDMGRIMEKIYRKTYLSPQSSSQIMEILGKQKYRDMIPRFIEDDFIISHKTGELKGLNHDIGIFSVNSIDYLLGIFTTDGENDYIGKETIGRLGKIIYESTKNRT